MPGIDSYTKIMLHFDGSDASTTITDSSATGHTFTAGGHGQLDTAIKKFGTAALLCDGSGDYVSCPDSAAFTLGSGDWTVDCWFYRTNNQRQMFGQGDGDVANCSIIGQISSSNKISLLVCYGATFGIITGTTSISGSTWYHFAGVRTGNTIKMFINGVQEGGDLSFTVSVNDSTSSFAVGALGDLTSSTWAGSIDEFRLSVGIARWTANFTPETAAYTMDIEAQLFTNTQTFFAATMVISQTITAALVTNTQSFFASAATYVTSITAALFTNTNTFYASSTLPVEVIFVNLFTNISVFFDPYVERAPGPPGPITDLYRRTSAQKLAFWRAVAASQFRHRR